VSWKSEEVKMRHGVIPMEMIEKKILNIREMKVPQKT
jgi:hypothetical protein